MYTHFPAGKPIPSLSGIHEDECAVKGHPSVTSRVFLRCRLNFRLTQACGDVLKEVCTDVCLDEENVDKACGGTVLRCLADKIDDITDDGCKSELLYFQKMEVSSKEANRLVRMFCTDLVHIPV